MNYNNSVNVATGLAPNEVHIGRMPRLPLTVFDRKPPGGHQSFDRDIAEYHISVWKVGEWAWVYNDIKTITQGASSSKSSPDKVLKSKLC